MSIDEKIEQVVERAISLALKNTAARTEVMLSRPSIMHRPTLLRASSVPGISLQYRDHHRDEYGNLQHGYDINDSFRVQETFWLASVGDLHAIGATPERAMIAFDDIFANGVEHRERVEVVLRASIHDPIKYVIAHLPRMR